MRSTLESIIKLPRQIPVETGARFKKDGEQGAASNKVDPTEKKTEKKTDESKKAETSPYSKGYIKCPVYDFF